MKINIRNKDFILRHYRLNDAPTLAKNIHDKTIAKFMVGVPYPYSEKDAQIFIKRSLLQYESKDRSQLNVAIDIKGEVAGGIGATFKGHVVIICYWVTKKYRGAGLAREAVRELVKFLFNQKGIIRIEAYTFLNNPRSQKLLLDLGFKNEGLLRKYIAKKGKYLDAFVFSKIKNDK